MIKYLIYIILFFCSIQVVYSQEDGVVSFDIPVRNSLKFNKFIINPTFSFVREQNRYLSFNNKKQWVEFDDAPQTYLFSYAGRFNENTGMGVGLFQQNYGILTTFGGVLNFAYNAVLNRDSNLTFGMNLGVYKSGINTGRVVTNFSDPSLDNMPSNTLITVNPGINYGTRFLDFGVSLKNLVLYNISGSEIVEDDPEQSIQGHIMYTGFMNSRGFFDEAKFSGLIRSEFKKNNTIVSGILMLTVPKGIWTQVGYNSLYGMSAGLGLNISTQISIEYNYEKAIGDLSAFGNSHDFTLGYKFKNNSRYNYSDDEEESALIIPAKKSRYVAARRKPTPKVKTKSNIKTKADQEAKQKLAAEAKAKADQEAKLAAEAKAKADVENMLRLEAETKSKAEQEAKLAAEAKAKADQEARQKLTAEAKAKADLEAKLAAEAKARADQEARQKLAAEAKAKADLEAKLAAEAKAIADQEARQKLAAEAKAKADLEAKLAAEAKAKLAAAAIPKDETTKSLVNLAKLTEEANVNQKQLLARLSETVAGKEQDLKNLKEENDLSEKGIYSAPKPFKSITAENLALESLRIEIDDIIRTQNNKITELENLYNKRLKSISSPEDSMNIIYLNTIKDL
ncbi:MAG TPA: type IX secretion system membrane protein PorP/SprF, partial [Vampirovibrionales bacterium]